MTQGAIIFFTAVNFLNFFDRYLVSALLPILRSDMGLSYEEGGRLVSAFVFGYFLFSPVFGVLGDRYNRLTLMALGVGLWSLATMATGYASGFFSFLAIRVFVGVGEASFGTIIPGFIKDKEPDPVRLNHVLSIFYTAIPVGSALAYVFAGQVAKYASWHTVFLFGGIPGLILAPFFLKFRDARTKHPEVVPVRDGLRAIVGVPLLLAAIAGYVLNSFALSGIAAFISELGVGLGFALDEITLIFGAILVVSGFLGTIVGGKISSRLASKSDTPLQVMMSFIGVSSLIAVPILGVVFLVHSHILFLVLCFIVETLIFAAMAPVNSVIVSACPKGLETLTQGITIFLLNFFGALLSPLLIGRVADVTGLPAAMQLTTGALLGCSLLWMLGGRLSLGKK